MSSSKKNLTILYSISVASMVILMLLSLVGGNSFFYPIIFIIIISIFFAYSLANYKDSSIGDSYLIKDNLETFKNLEYDTILDEIISVTNSSANGDFRNQIKINSSNEKYQQIANNVNKTLSNMHLSLDTILLYLEKFQKNDFTVTLENHQSEDLKVLIEAINKLNIKISRMLLSSLKNGVKLKKNSDSLKENLNELTKNMISEAATLEETASAVEEVTSSVINNNSNVEEILSYSNILTSSVKNGYESAKNSALFMEIINEKTKSIEAAIVVIDQIAFQTNILSLNAAVEAATAGEAGRGFAVVAAEVRNLASRSAEAAKEIKILVSNATDEANKGKNASSEMMKEYDILNENINKTKSLIENISISLKEQQRGMEQINKAISQIDTGTQENASKAQDTMQIADENDNMATSMVVETNKTKFFGRDEYNSTIM
jgi:methyl-accepting chemotaxis protein